MNSISLDHKIHTFLKMKENEIPELKRKSVDQMIEDLVNEGELSRVY